MRFLVDADGVARNRERMKSIAERLADLRPVGDQVLDELAAAQRRHFRAAPWPPLARSTRARKRRQRLPLRAMEASGLLEDTLSRRSPQAQRRGQLTRRGRASVVFGIKRGKVAIFYGRMHHKGQGVPKRAVIAEPTRLTRMRLGRLVLDHATQDAR